MIQAPQWLLHTGRDCSHLLPLPSSQRMRCAAVCSPAHPTSLGSVLRLVTSPSFCPKTPAWRTLALIHQLKESSLLFSGYILRSTATASVPEPPAPSKPPRWLCPKHSTRIIPPKVTGEPDKDQYWHPFLFFPPCWNLAPLFPLTSGSPASALSTMGTGSLSSPRPQTPSPHCLSRCESAPLCSPPSSGSFSELVAPPLTPF